MGAGCTLGNLVTLLSWLEFRNQKMKHIFVGVAAVLMASTSLAQQSTSKSMSFDDCLRVIQRTATQLGVAPFNIVETRDMRMVRFPTSGGSVVVTCSRPDRKMVMTVSNR